MQIEGERRAWSRQQLITLASEQRFVGTFTGRHGASDTLDHPQPALWTLSSIHEQSGQQEFPILFGETKTMTINARHLRDGAHLVVNGRRVSGAIETGEEEQVAVTLDTLPSSGMHFLQVQNPDGLFSNDFIFHVAEDEAKAQELRYQNHPDLLRDALAEAIEEGNLEETKRFLDAGAPLNARRSSSGMTPLNTAVFHDHTEIVKHLIEDRKARVSHDNRDGNTPLHLAAFLCRTDLVEYLLDKGASVNKRSDRGERAVDTVTAPWSEGLAGFYRSLSDRAGLNLNLEEIERLRPQMVNLLNDSTGEPDDALGVLSRGAEGWRYWDANAAPPADWFAVDFDESEWKTGQAPLGYGEEDIATSLSFGSDARSKRPAAFFRKEIQIDDPNASKIFAMGIRADDGAVVYLNGKEIRRLRMPDGAISHRTFSAGNTQSDSGLEGELIPFKIDPKALRMGENVIAVSVHQRHGASSDLVLDLEIMGISQVDFNRLVRSRSE